MALADRGWLLWLIYDFFQLRLRDDRVFRTGTLEPACAEHCDQQSALSSCGACRSRPRSRHLTCELRKITIQEQRLTEEVKLKDLRPLSAGFLHSVQEIWGERLWQWLS